MKTATHITTGFFSLLLLVATFCELISSKKDDFSDHVDAIVLFGGGLLLTLFLVNLVFYFATTNGRVGYGFGCVTIAITSCLLFFLVKWIDAERHRWFIGKGIREYERYVRLIEENRHILSSRAQNIGKILAPAPYEKNEIMAATNSDGSLFVMFIGRGNDPRAGYVYYSGKVRNPVFGASDLYRLDDSKKEFRNITNNWYEY